MGKRYSINITLTKELYEYLEGKAKEEVRSIASAGLFYIVKGVQAEQETASSKDNR